jgi:hypothetical protein
VQSKCKPPAKEPGNTIRFDLEPDGLTVSKGTLIESLNLLYVSIMQTIPLTGGRLLKIFSERFRRANCRQLLIDACNEESRLCCIPANTISHEQRDGCIDAWRIDGWITGGGIEKTLGIVSVKRSQLKTWPELRFKQVE